MIDHTTIDWGKIAYELVKTLHYIIVLFDDFLCAEFALSRKARGKHVQQFDNN